MIVLVHGPDAATARAAVARVLRHHDPDGTNTSRLDGRTATPAQVLAQVASVGFFGAPRAVVVTDLMTRAFRAGANSASADTDEEATAGAALDLAPLLAGVPPENLLVLVDVALTAIPAAVKRAAPKDAVIVAADPPRGAELIRWVGDAAKTRGAAIEPAAARALLVALYPQTWASRPSNPRFDRPPDLDRLENEIEKLALAAHPGPIAPSLVGELVGNQPEDRVFPFVEAAAARNLPAAVAELGRLLDAGEEPAKAAAQVQQQIELALVLDEAGPRRDPVAVGRELGLANPNRMAGIAGARRQRAIPPARTVLPAALDVERRTKRGELRHPEDGLYHLLGSTAGPTGSGPRTRNGGT